MNQEAQTKLEAVTKNADRGAEDIERLNAELARREDEIEGVCLELDDFRNQSSATPGSSEYRSSEPPSYVSLAFLDRYHSLPRNFYSSPTMHIVSTLPDDCHNTLPPIKKRTLLASHMDDGDESEDPFGPLDVGSNPNLFSEYTQQLSTGDSATPKPSELSTTLVGCLLYPLSYSNITLEYARFLEIPKFSTKHANQYLHSNSRSPRRRRSRGARYSTVIPWESLQPLYESNSSPLKQR